jgi:hypothetical protein
MERLRAGRAVGCHELEVSSSLDWRRTPMELGISPIAVNVLIHLEEIRLGGAKLVF